jgi:hypothetical protein
VRRSNDSDTHSGRAATGTQNSGTAVKSKRSFTISIIANMPANRPSCVRKRRTRF